MNINLIKIRFFTLSCFVMSVKLDPLRSLVLYSDITKEESVKDLILIRLNEHEQNTPMMYEQDYGSTLQRTREAHL